jgi:hypothetical protein
MLTVPSSSGAGLSTNADIQREISLATHSAKSPSMPTRPTYLECWVISLNTCLGYEQVHVLYWHTARLCQTLERDYEDTDSYFSLSVKGKMAREDSMR